jgi:hypothetical protein
MRSKNRFPFLHYIMWYAIRRCGKNSPRLAVKLHRRLKEGKGEALISNKLNGETENELERGTSFVSL